MDINFLFFLFGSLKKRLGDEKMPYSLRNAAKSSLPPAHELDVHIKENGEFPKSKIIHGNSGDALWDALCITEEQYLADVDFLKQNSCDGEVSSENGDR